ncbi:MAG: hypothetical protein KC421_06600 [Anaerolineales bacterium]|nr:hypothetical protein [Anaerolineales bacterium]
MTTSDISKWLQAGIAALKAGDRAKARTLLIRVVDVDEQNEQGWLWLSGAVTSNEDRRRCLENVLLINPENKSAKKGLIKLGIDPEGGDEEETAVSPPTPSPQSQTVRREYQPLSPAAAILYPDRQVKEWEWHDPTPEHQASNVAFTAQTQYDDVWSQEADICAYCAAKIETEDERCPQCNRKLVIDQFRYPKPSTNLHVFWVLLFGIGFFSLIQLFVNIVAERDILQAILNGILMVVFTGLAVGVYFRQMWAYSSALVLLILMLAFALFQYLLPPSITSSLLAGFDPAITRTLTSLAGGIGGIIRVFRLAAVAIALFLAIVQVAPDFERVQVKQLAVLGGRMRTGSDYHDTAKRAGRMGQWATAVLHWQRACALEPTHLLYQQHLGQAYAQLGFHRRSLDVLQSARSRATHPDKQAELDQLIQAVQQNMAAAQAS